MPSNEFSELMNIKTPSPNLKEAIEHLPIHALVQITGLDIINMQIFATENEMLDYQASYDCLGPFKDTSETNESTTNGIDATTQEHATPTPTLQSVANGQKENENNGNETSQPSTTKHDDDNLTLSMDMSQLLAE